MNYKILTDSEVFFSRERYGSNKITPIPYKSEII
jgi:hypothetical protein